MEKVLIIGSGIAGMSCAIHCAQLGLHSVLTSPFPSERSQSVMAAGGINSVISNNNDENDSVEIHIEDTLKGGSFLAGKNAVTGLCSGSEQIIRYLESIGTVFSVDYEGKLLRRAFGGQSKKRTFYCGSSTGKHIVSSLVMECRRYENEGLITRNIQLHFHSALIDKGICYGALLFDEKNKTLEPIFADFVVMATGGQNSIYGKTTGTTSCDGYAVGKLFMQGAVLKNLEFVQFHPTTLETSQKNMLISEAVRGEGGRLFYVDDAREDFDLKGAVARVESVSREESVARGKSVARRADNSSRRAESDFRDSASDRRAESDRRVYFMEEKYGANGNLMTRDVVSREIDSLIKSGKKVFLDISFMDKNLIKEKLSEVYELCKKYGNIDITKESIPVVPSVHFFMGGLAVHLNHETNIKNLYAVGECASMYHGANRLGGNSLLSALYSGKIAAKDISEKIASRSGANSVNGADGDGISVQNAEPDFSKTIEDEKKAISDMLSSKSFFSVTVIKNMLAETMKNSMGIVRTEEELKSGIEDVDYYLSIIKKIHYDSSVSSYLNYSLEGVLTLARALITCAEKRKESRGSHYRGDFPQSLEEYESATLISYDNGAYTVQYDRDREYEN